MNTIFFLLLSLNSIFAFNDTIRQNREIQNCTIYNPFSNQTLCSECESGYALTNRYECLKYPDNCDEGFYDNTTNETLCSACHMKYSLNSSKKCVFCGDQCKYCTLNEKDKETSCITCFSYLTIDNGQCKKNIDYCSDQRLINNNESICKECHDQWALYPDNNSCIRCDSIQPQCNLCRFNEQKEFECLQCKNYSNFQVYISNEFKCLDLNNDKAFSYLKGCMIAVNNKTSNKYECLSCNQNYSLEENEKVCKNICLEHTIIEQNGYTSFSCNICQNNLTLITIYANNTNISEKKCFKREGNLSYCLEGKIDEKGDYICTKCIENANLNGSNICECNKDSFGINNEWCFKCDEEKEGNPGCLAEKGCDYDNKNKYLKCKACKDGYYLKNKDECFPCSKNISHCEKCHFNEDKSKLECDSCSSIYSLNKNSNECELNECQEYPEISPGCIICNDKLEEYKSKNICQSCKYGYFKTKEGKCIYCRSEKYGGPACYECGYEQDYIICKDCFSIYDYIGILNDYNLNAKFYRDYEFKNYFDMGFLGPDRKCYDLIYNNLAEIYHPNPDFSIFFHKYENISNCDIYRSKYLTFKPNQKGKLIDNFNYYVEKFLYPKGDDANYIRGIIDYYLNAKNIYAKCLRCKVGYYINDRGECEILDIKKCTGRFILQNTERRMFGCIDSCIENNYPFIYLRLKNYTIDYENEEHIQILPFYDLVEEHNFIKVFDHETQDILLNNTICYILPKESSKNNKFKGCEKLLYIPKKDSYQCIECNFDYVLDTENNNTCISKYEYDEQEENNKEEKNTTFNDIDEKRCYDINGIFIIWENRSATCWNGNESDIPDHMLNIFKNCSKVKANTSYYDITFDCISCYNNLTVFYDEFYEKYVCYNYSHENNYTSYLKKVQLEKNKTVINKTNTCEKNYFSPDGKYCYKCDNNNIGMPGCKGECSFSKNRYNMLQCESGCKDGYFERNKNLCRHCKDNCAKCHYEPNDQDDDPGITKLVCDYCEEGYVLTKEGYCDKYIITKTSINNKYISCGNKTQGGIENCLYCENNEQGNKAICRQCKDNYILLTNNNTCLNRNNEQLKEFETCLELYNESNKFICSRCKPQFSLLKAKDKNITNCTHTPTLFDSNFIWHYFFHNYFDVFHKKYDEFYVYFKNDYDFRQALYFPCKQSINLGNSENPLYSCEKCYNIFSNEIYDEDYYYNYLPYYLYDNDDINYLDYEDSNNYYNFTQEIINSFYGYLPLKIIDTTKKNISYFKVTLNETKNCKEAIYNIFNGKEIYNCSKCRNNYVLVYDEFLDINYCNFSDSKKNNTKDNDTCDVEYCKSCNDSDTNKCLECNIGYKVNKFTGACIKIMDEIPSVIWKDIYGYNKTSEKIINRKKYKGPLVKLLGITSNRIYEKNTFEIILIFILKSGLRSLEDKQINISALCENEKGVEVPENGIKEVIYVCIGNAQDKKLDNYDLSGIDNGNNSGIIKNIGLKEMNNLISIANNTGPNYKEVDKEIIFEINNSDKDKEQISKNNKFDFTLNGKIKTNKNISTKERISAESIKMTNTDEKAKAELYPENEKINFILEIKNEPKSNPINFESDIIQANDYIINIPNLNTIKLNYKRESSGESVSSTIVDKEDGNIVNTRTNDSGINKTSIIVVSIIGGVIFLGGLTIVVIYLVKHRKASKNILEISKAGNSNVFESSTNNIN